MEDARKIEQARLVGQARENRLKEKEDLRREREEQVLQRKREREEERLRNKLRSDPYYRGLHL